MEPDTIPPPPRRRIPRWVWIAGGVVVALALAILIPRWIVGRKIEAELAALRAEGYPTTLEELEEWYERPAGENAADTLAKAFTLYSSGNEAGVPVVSDERLPAAGEPLPADVAAKIAAYLASNAKAIQMLHAGAVVPDCRYPIGLRSGVNALLPHLSSVRQGARLLMLEAVTAAENGEPEQAADALEAGLGLSRSLRNEPLLISQMVRYAVHGLSCNAAAQVMSRSPLSDAHLMRLAELVASEEDLTGFRRGMAGEICSTHAVICQIGGPDRLRQSIVRASGLFHATRLRYLKSSRKAMALTELPLRDAISGAQEMEKELKERTKRRKLPFPDLSAMLELAWINIFTNCARDLAHLESMRAACAVERFRLAKGRLPDSLAELVPRFIAAVPEDPFDGKPLRYRKEDKGYVIYSIGMNMKDEGGVVPVERIALKPDDVIFRVAR